MAANHERATLFPHELLQCLTARASTMCAQIGAPFTSYQACDLQDLNSRCAYNADLPPANLVLEDSLDLISNVGDPLWYLPSVRVFKELCASNEIMYRDS